MASEILTLTALVMVGTAALLLATRRRRGDAQAVERKLASVRRISIAKARGGEAVKIFGRVRARGPLLSAPLTGEPCVLWEIEVEAGDSSGYGRELLENETSEFYVEDATGRALIRTKAPRLLLLRDRVAHNGPFAIGDPRAAEFVRSRGLGREVFARERRLSEGKLEEGESIAVYGMGHWESDSERREAGGGDYRSTPRILVIEDHDELPIHITDDPEATA